MALELAVDWRIDNLLEAIILMLPAMIANATPVVAGGRRPVDMGIVLPDGRRLLGDGKTVEGLLAGFAAGSAAGVLAALATANMLLAVHSPAIALGALAGDMAGSFVKRRLGIERGRPAPLLDQLDFYLGALAVSIALGYTWTPRVVVEAAAAVLLLHLAANVTAYLLGLKKVPW
ncbi:CDP-archaeol synthase [Aeropyrum pernix]|uniref:CDP-archaeol synthase n=1 Tax=Aeropyrum pernix TaxID=56636 RepID=A0A401H9P2_AERPX|nr:CDP-2,3-bis-(O-geranylgeranyl)-sn-glycerol synthase [Aeropyrum pernix]GBF09088.1 CDP-archaeol synthase [Aeropyrum pernix]